MDKVKIDNLVNDFERYKKYLSENYKLDTGEAALLATKFLDLEDKYHKTSDYLIGRRDFTNMATKFSNRDALHIIKTMNTNKRIDVLASMIKFRPEALDAFEKITNHSLSLFCEQIGTPLYQGMTKA